MKIIKHGVIPTKPEQLRFECSFCGCEYANFKNEFKMKVKKYGMAKKSYTLFISRCPECKREVTKVVGPINS